MRQKITLFRWRSMLFTAAVAGIVAGIFFGYPRLGAAQVAGANGYTNSDGSVIDKPLSAVLGWALSSFWAGLPKPPAEHVQGYHFPVVCDAQGVAPARPSELSVTWIGHATALIRINGTTVLTDPHFSERASPLSWVGPRRRTPLPYALEELPHIDVVVISHNHFDHLDEPSVLALVRQSGGAPVFIVPQGLDRWFTERAIPTVHSLGWWQTYTLNGFEVVGTPARHWSGRDLTDRNQTQWSGWVLRSGGMSAYFAGDSGYSADFAAIGQRLGPFDLALIPVGAYLPRDFMADQHASPTEAVMIHQDVRATVSVGIH